MRTALSWSHHVQLIWPLALLSRHLKIKLMASGLNEGPEVDMHMSPKGRASDQPGVAGRDVRERERNITSLPAT